MKDLLIFVADADAQAFMRGILSRPQALAVRTITFDIERHPLHDSGILQNGAELARMKKGYYRKALLMWDHHGSGCEHKHAAEEVQATIQAKLDSFTWEGNSAVTVLVPELEQWLWFCESALAAHCGITANQLAQWVDEHAEKLGKTSDALKAEEPKELFGHVMRKQLKHSVFPHDFEKIGQRASIPGLMKCKSFQSVAETLRAWFPALKQPSGEWNDRLF
jgi:hypothetical protein